MAVILFAFLATLVQGYPANVPRGDSAVDWFSASNLNAFDDGTVITSLKLEEQTSPSSIWDLDASMLTLDFPQEYFPASQLLTSTNEGHTQTLFGDLVADSDPSFGSFEPIATTTNYGSENSASIPTSNCEDSALETGDFLAGYDPNEDSSFNIFDQSVSVANADDNLSMFNLKGREIRYGGGGGAPYVPVSRYDLDPNTSPNTPNSEAYAADGTPLRPMQCPNGKTKACCTWDAFPPFSQCWPAVRFTPASVCRLAKNQFCCAKIPEPGGMGIDCEQMKWSKARDGRKQREPTPPTSSQFQEIFPILQPLPELNPNPDFCSPRRR